MLKSVKLALLTVLSLVSLAFGGEIISGVCVSVADGDTITVLDDRDNTTKHKVRLYGVDAPEKSQEWGQESKAALTALVWQKRVSLDVVSTDKYQRKVSKVTYRDERGGELNVNLYMVTTGNAWFYEAYAKNEPTYKIAEENARKKKHGLWSQENPVAPWLYRKGLANDGETKLKQPEIYWVSKTTHKVHNARCLQYFGKGQGELTPTPKGENCGVCGGREN